MPMGTPSSIRTKRAVHPTAYNLRIEPDPEAADPRAKRLVVWLPLEGEDWVMPLPEEMVTYLHDATGPSIYVADAASLPDPPPGVS